MLARILATATAVAVFALLLIGATVNPKGASLACPEAWFVCHGELFPEMAGGVLYEHGHRLAAMTIGLLQIALTIVLWRRYPRLRSLGVIGLIMVCLQGSFGAATVYLGLSVAVSTTHLCFALSYFALILYTHFRIYTDDKEPARTARTTPSAPVPLTMLTTAGVLLFVQIAVGGLVRHTNAYAACTDLPFCDGTQILGDSWRVWLHMGHRLLGVIAGCVVIVAATRSWRAASRGTALRRLSALSIVLVAVQIFLGILVVWTLRSTHSAVAHLGGAAALWGTWVYLWLLNRRQIAAYRAYTRPGTPSTAQPLTTGLPASA